MSVRCRAHRPVHRWKCKSGRCRRPERRWRRGRPSPESSPDGQPPPAPAAPPAPPSRPCRSWCPPGSLCRAPCLRPHPKALLYVRLRKYNASTVSRKRDIVHVEENETAESSAAAISASADPGSESDYLTLLGERVRETRARRGMTRKILARDSGVSERYLAQLETGQGNVSILLLRQIAQALDTPLQALVLDGPEPPVDLVHTTEFLRRLPAAELVEARRLLVENFGGVDLEARRGRIALVGLRGAGKSTLGAMLADRLEAPFLELDRLIEQESGVSLSVIFDLYGQSGFRRLERRVLDQVIERYPRFVLATGGSLVSEPATF